MSSHIKNNNPSKQSPQYGPTYDSNPSKEFKVDIVAFGSDNMPSSLNKSPKFGYRSKYSKEATGRKTDEDYLLIKQKIKHTENIANNIAVRKDPSRSKSKSRLGLSGLHDQSANGENYFASQSTDRGRNRSMSPKNTLNKSPLADRQSGFRASKESNGELKKYELPLTKKVVIQEHKFETEEIQFVPVKRSTSGRSINLTPSHKSDSQKKLQNNAAQGIPTRVTPTKNKPRISSKIPSQVTTNIASKGNSSVKNRGVVKVDISPDRILQVDSARHVIPPKTTPTANLSPSYQKETNASSSKKIMKYEPVNTSSRKISHPIQHASNKNSVKDALSESIDYKTDVKPTTASSKKILPEKKLKTVDVCIKIEENKGNSPGSKNTNKSPSSTGSPQKNSNPTGKYSSADRHSYENSPQKILREENGTHYVLEVSREVQISQPNEIVSTKPKHSPSSSGGQQTQNIINKKYDPNLIESKHDESPRFVGQNSDKIRFQTGSRSPSRGSGTGDSPLQHNTRNSPSTSNANTHEVTFRQKGANQSGKQSNTSSASRRNSDRSIDAFANNRDELARANRAPNPIGRIEKPNYHEDENLPHFGVITFFDSYVPNNNEEEELYNPPKNTKLSSNNDVFHYQSPHARQYSPDPE